MVKRLIKKESEKYYPSDAEESLNGTNFYVNDEERVKVKDTNTLDEKAIQTFLLFWEEGSEHFMTDKEKAINIGDRWEEVIEYCIQHYPKSKYEGIAYRFIEVGKSELDQYLPNIRFEGTNNRDGKIIVEQGFSLTEEDIKNILLEKFITNYGKYQSFTTDEDHFFSRSNNGIIVKIAANISGLNFDALSDLSYNGDYDVTNYDNIEDEIIARLPNDIEIELLNVKDILEDHR